MACRFRTMQTHQLVQIHLTDGVIAIHVAKLRVRKPLATVEGGDKPCEGNNVGLWVFATESAQLREVDVVDALRQGIAHVNM